MRELSKPSGSEVNNSKWVLVWPCGGEGKNGKRQRRPSLSLFDDGPVVCPLNWSPPE